MTSTDTAIRILTGATLMSVAVITIMPPASAEHGVGIRSCGRHAAVCRRSSGSVWPAGSVPSITSAFQTTSGQYWGQSGVRGVAIRAGSPAMAIPPVKSPIQYSVEGYGIVRLETHEGLIRFFSEEPLATYTIRSTDGRSATYRHEPDNAKWKDRLEQTLQEELTFSEPSEVRQELPRQK